MKIGDRVILIEDMQELKAGIKGSVVECITRLPGEAKSVKMLGVRFDRHIFPSATREINGQQIPVIKKCCKL